MAAGEQRPNCLPQLEVQPSCPGDEKQRGCKRKLGRREAALLIFGSGVLVGAILTLLILRVRPLEPCPPPPPGFRHVCPNGWLGLQGKCFYFSDTKRDWNSSREHCQQHGASLATLDTEEQTDFVHRYQGWKHHWIGLHRAGGDERWTWADGRTFTNRSIAGTGPCGYLSSTGFNSTFCHDAKFFVCIKADSFVLWRNGMQPH
ncbi:C-type lectin domain family 2 member B-like [Lagopus muta]|uniref:C-type lectin domain family 2 member B-like n=1 Tax=Lagopus muta TaxID=64668 RepID=UPI00209E235E|nr:C-type lectin domain family 2 member B-like [Lagopus muta]